MLYTSQLFQVKSFLALSVDKTKNPRKGIVWRSVDFMGCRSISIQLTERGEEGSAISPPQGAVGWRPRSRL